MKIIIETETEVSPKEVFAYFRQKSLEALRNFQISIEGTDLNYKTQEVKKDD